MCCSSGVAVEVAYTESLDVKTGNEPTTFGFLDTMNGQALLASQGGDIVVEGLDGTAALQSHGGNIQVRQTAILHGRSTRDMLRFSLSAQHGLH